MKILRKIKITIRILFFLLLLGCIITGVLFYPEYKSLKEEFFDALTQMDESNFIRAGNTEIYGTDGKLIGRLGNEKYEYLDIHEIPESVIKGYIDTEDQNFYTHMGIDLKGTFRAVVALIKNQGKITQGGSTITQQVIKNTLLTRERSYKRKILEMFLALEMEKHYNKAEIMEFYCNTCYYGENCYGIEGASEYYFGKPASKMTLAEAAILVGTSNSPNKYNPVADYELAMKKKAFVLKNMLECGDITQEEYDAALEESPEVVKKTVTAEAESYPITYAIHCAALEVMKQDHFSFEYLWDTEEEYEAYEERYSKAYSEAVSEIRGGGYIIRTSLDSNLQKKLQKSVDTTLLDFTAKQEDGRYSMQGAAVCIDNSTQMVVAVVGGRGEDDSFNRGYQAKRQPGSCIKPLLDYGPAINEGLVTPGTILNDERFSYNGYSPKNQGDHYYGKVSLRQALGRSLNTIALRLFEMTGKNTCLSYLEKMCFSSLEYADTTIASIALGGFTQGVTVSDMARGYATLANQGNYSTNTCILSIEHYADGLIFECENEKVPVFSEDTAFMVTDILQGVFQEEYGTARKLASSGQNYAGKTGTTNNSKDAWFCGYSTYYTTAVWCGCDLPKPVKDLYGSTYPGTIWKEFMDEIHKDLKKEAFPIPSTIRLETQNGIQKSVNGSRTSGWDYYSTLTEEKVRLAEEERMEKANQKAAEEAVSKFESYQIHSVADAEGLNQTYQNTVDVIGQVGDSEVRSGFMRRASYKYHLLDGEVTDTWKTAIEESKAAESAQKDAENLEAAQNSLEEAERIRKESLENVAKWYIDHLIQRTLYSSYTEQMIQDGEKAVEACRDMDSYISLRTEFDQAKAYAQNLPTQKYSDVQETLPSESDYPDIPSESQEEDWRIANPE